MSTTHVTDLAAPGALRALGSSPGGEHPELDFMPLGGIDHVELWVGNAAQASYFFQRAFSFTEVAYRGLETGERDRVSRVLEQGEIRLVLTGALSSDSEVARDQGKHGDGVKVIALSVPDVDHAYREATTRGAT
ncbi:MAG TPA: VOC family protein, partial [Solirubrobacteraceae bacterium]